MADFIETNWADIVVSLNYLFALVVALIAVILVRRSIPVSLNLEYLPLTKKRRQLGLQFLDLEGNNTAKNSVGKVGELVTAMMLIGRGWRQLPSQPTGVQGIDAIFVKQGGGAFKVAFVETKASQTHDPTNNYGGEMSRDKILADLRSCAEQKFQEEQFMPPSVARSLISAINRSSFHVRAYLYAHTFETGKTRIYSIAQSGNRSKRPLRVVSTETHLHMLQALAIGIARLLKARPNLDVDSVGMVGPALSTGAGDSPAGDSNRCTGCQSMVTSQYK